MQKSQAPVADPAPSVTAQTAPTTDASANASQTSAPSPTPNPPATADVPEPVDLHLAAMAEAERENTKRGFMDRVMQARANQKPKEYTPPERPAGIVKTTNEEMAAGAALVAKRAAEDALRKVPPKEKWDGDTTSVFRPADYVPDPKKNQGVNLGARTLSSQ